MQGGDASPLSLSSRAAQTAKDLAIEIHAFIKPENVDSDWEIPRRPAPARDDKIRVNTSYPATEGPSSSRDRDDRSAGASPVYISQWNTPDSESPVSRSRVFALVA